MNESESLGLHSFNEPSDPLSAAESAGEARREQFSLEEREKQSANISYEELERRDLAEFPFTVYHPEGERIAPKFRTWKEALTKQVEWNKECPGHRARRRFVRTIKSK